MAVKKKKQTDLLTHWKKQVRGVVGDLEKKLLKGIEAKKREFALAFAKLEKKHAALLLRSAAVKSKPKSRSVKKGGAKKKHV